METQNFLQDGPVDPFSNPKLCPTDAAGTKINSARYGCSRDNGTTWHGGTDLKAEEGTSFVAIYSGIVSDIRNLLPTHADYKKGVGNFIIVKSGAFSIKYCHLSVINVQKGATITAGQVIGKTGSSGNAYNVPHKHLHIEISTDHFLTMNKYVDPEPYLKTRYKSDGSVAGISDTPKNPNDSNHSSCPALAEEELQEIEIQKNLKENQKDNDGKHIVN